jgi:hypothetical protein
MTNETLRMQMLSGVITEGQYKAKLQENKKKKSLKESMIGGIVGIGAINQIPPRAKADYELAFEHFLGERYENREQDPHTMKEAKDLSFTFNYNTDEDDVAYIQRLLKQAGVDATAKAGIDSEEMVVKASNAIELRKAKKAISSDGFQIHENREQDPYTMKEAEMPAVDSRIKNDANFQKLASYFKQNPDKAEDVKDELSSLKEAYEKDGKYYDEDEYGDKKEITFKKYLIAKLVNIGLPAAVLGLVGALMAGPLGVMAPGEILQAIGIAAGIGGAAGAALDYGETKPIGEVEEKVNEGKLDGLYMELKDVLFPYYTDLRGEERVSMIDDVIKELNSYISILQNEKRAKQ